MRVDRPPAGITAALELFAGLQFPVAIHVEPLASGETRWAVWRTPAPGRVETGDGTHRVELNGARLARIEDTAEREAICFTACVHELTHAWQWERWGDPLLRLDDLLRNAICATLLDGPERLAALRLRPVELDANALATAAVRARFSKHVEAVRAVGLGSIGEHAAGPLSLETLPQRTLALLATRPELVAGICEQRVVERLDDIFDGAGRWWRLAVDSAVLPVDG